MYISDFHALTIVSLMLIISVVFLMLAFKLYKTTAYNIFYVGTVLFLLIGYLLAHNLAGETIVLRGNSDLLKGVLTEIIVFWAISSVGLFLQFKRKRMVESLNLDIKFKKKLQRIGNIAAVLTSLFIGYILIAIDLSSAPLMNIGTYSFNDMSYYRSMLFTPAIVQKTYIVQYFVSYLIIPALFLVRGMGMKINRLCLALFLFFSLLTLSKTFFVLIVAFYFVGRFVTTENKREIFKMVGVITTGFFLIVYAAYYVDVQRGLGEVLMVLVIRMLVAPVSLSALYAHLFTFEQGLRSSEYYTYLFGGEAVSISQAAMKYMAPNSEGNSPAGIIGSAYPNIPTELHFFYYLIFIAFILIGSNMAVKINNYYIFMSLSGAFGIASWFLFLTDPLSALNSYGLLYMFGVIFILGVFVKKRKFRKVTWKRNEKVVHFNNQ